MPHTYEELRAAALDVLARREQVPHEPNQYENLSLGIGHVFARREGRLQPGQFGAMCPLDAQDKQLLLELFWDLFRQGVISLGMNDSNREFPFFHLTRLGHQLAQGQEAYFFHDVSSYEAAIRKEVPTIDDVTLLYLKEAMQAFRAGCMLSATVMLGVSVEHTFEKMIENLKRHSTHKTTFASVFSERGLSRRFNKFRNVIDSLAKELPPAIKEDLDTHFAGILSVIRAYRNESGHPTGKIIDREQTFVLLQLFIPYNKKIYQLREHFK
jgi:hypothetical protein